MDSNQAWLDGVLGAPKSKTNNENNTSTVRSGSSGRVGGAIVSGVAEVASRLLGNTNQEDINREQLSKDIKVQQARLDSDRNAQLIQALGNIRGPMSLLTNVIGVAVAQSRKPRISTTDESSSSVNTTSNANGKGGNYEPKAEIETKGPTDESWRERTPKWAQDVGDGMQEGWNKILRRVGIEIK